MVPPECTDDRRAHREPPDEHIRTAYLRQRPDFVIIGAQRGGTTSLFHYLSGHPGVGQTWRKEVHFFDRDEVYREKGLDWYLAHFPLREEACVVGEATPSYLDHPNAPDRALATVPNAKFIVLLRDPVARAYSHYQMQKRRGIETRAFSDAIAIGLERSPVIVDSDRVESAKFAYVERGLYLKHLTRWTNTFPQDRFLILKSEDMYEDAQPILLDTLAFLGLTAWSPNRFRVHHLSSYEGMDQATHRRLIDYFAPHNRALYAFLGRDFGWEEP